MKSVIAPWQLWIKLGNFLYEVSNLYTVTLLYSRVFHFLSKVAIRPHLCFEKMIQRCLWCCAKLSKRLLSVYRKNRFIVLCALSPFRNPISGLVVSLSALWFRVSLHVWHTFSCASPVGAVRTAGWPWVLPAALCACPTSLQPRSIQCYTSVGLEPWKRRECLVHPWPVELLG